MHAMRETLTPCKSYKTDTVHEAQANLDRMNSKQLQQEQISKSNMESKAKRIQSNAPRYQNKG